MFPEVATIFVSDQPVYSGALNRSSSQMITFCVQTKHLLTKIISGLLSSRLTRCFQMLFSRLGKHVKCMDVFAETLRMTGVNDSKMKH